MYSNVFTKTMRDGRTSTLLCGIGLFLIGLYVAVLFPSIGEDFAGMLDNFPDFLKSIIGEASEFATPEGFFSTQPFGVLGPILIVAFAINRGVGMVAGEEESGTLDQMMANPVSRTTMLVQKSLALLIQSIVLAVFLGASLMLGGVLVDFTFSIGGMIQMLLSFLLLGWSMGFLALAVGAATGSKSMAMAISSSVIGVGYLIHIIWPLQDAVEFTKYISVMYYYIGDRPFVNGITYWHAGVLAVIAIVSCVFSIYAFNNRDLH